MKEWYKSTAPQPGDGKERKDHTPFVLEQLSREPRQLPTLTLKDNITSETNLNKNTENTDTKKRNCNYSVKWESDMDMFNNKEIETNPFAKSDAEHCRTGFQCKSGKCNQFYCEQ